MLHRGLVLASRLGVFVGRALPIVGLLLFVAGLVAFAPLLWKLIDDELAPVPTVEPAATAPAASAEWTVLSRTRWVRVGSWFESCLTYSTPAGTHQRCDPIRASIVSDRMVEAQRCWETARIGSPLPSCWR